MTDETKVIFSFGVNLERTQWALFVMSEKEIKPQQYIEALRRWLEHFQDTPDLLDETVVSN